MASSPNPGAPPDSAGGAGWRGLVGRFAREVREGPEQGRYVALAVAAVLALYVVGLIVANYKTVRVSFVIASAPIPLLWLIVLCVALGVGLGWILRGRHERRRSARRPTSPGGAAR